MVNVHSALLCPWVGSPDTTTHIPHLETTWKHPFDLHQYEIRRLSGEFTVSELRKSGVLAGMESYYDYKIQNASDDER